MKSEQKKFLYKLLTTPGPSGYEERIQVFLKEYIKEYADEIKVDLHGNLIAAINPKAKKKVMLAGHCDQIGFVVQSITSTGFIKISALGGIDFSVVPGSKAQIHTKKATIAAVFGRKPIHLQDRGERVKVTVGDKENFLDIGALDEKEAKEMVQVGDPVTFELSVTELANNLISSPGLDDRAGCYVAFETLRRCRNLDLNVGLYAVSTIQEEVGLRGAVTSAYSIDPEVGIAIDVTHASDSPATKGSKMNPIKLGSGPTVSKGLNTNIKVETALRKAAKTKKLEIQTDLCTYPGGNDGSAMQLTRGGKATAVIGIPCRYMHTNVEVVSMDDLDTAVEVLVEFISKIKVKDSFIPY